MEYTKFVKTTFAYRSGINSREHMTPNEFIINILHCALGIASEYIEYTNELRNVSKDLLEDQTAIDKETYKKPLKELGDILYYCTMYMNLIETSDQAIREIVEEGYPAPDKLHSIGDQVEIVVDLIKKSYIYGQDIALKPIVKEILYLIFYLDLESLKLGSCLDEIKNDNQAKLELRYPKGKFDTNDSAIKADQIN